MLRITLLHVGMSLNPANWFCIVWDGNRPLIKFSFLLIDSSSYNLVIAVLVSSHSFSEWVGPLLFASSPWIASGCCCGGSTVMGVWCVVMGALMVASLASLVMSGSILGVGLTG